MKKKIVRLDLEDHGQDFLSFYVKDSTIIGTTPFQGWIWNGRKLRASEFKAGDIVIFADGNTLKYPIEKVVPIGKKRLAIAKASALGSFLKEASNGR